MGFEQLSNVPGLDAARLGLDYEVEQLALQTLDANLWRGWIEHHIEREQVWFAVLKHLMTTDPSDLTAIVLDGVRVCKGSIIGAGCVVTKDVPAYSLMVGVPAKCLRQVEIAEADGLILHAQKYEQLALVHAGKGTDLGFVD